MANIRVTSLPEATTVASDDVFLMDGAATRKITPANALNSIRPFASQAEAEAGVVATKGMSPLTTKQAISAQLPSTSLGRSILNAPDSATARTSLGLGNASTRDVGTASGTVAAGDDSRITDAAQKSANLSDLASASTARTNLGLGDSATRNVGDSAGTVAAGDDIRFGGIGALASQAEAEAGAVNDKLMSPLRTKQAIDAQRPATAAGLAILNAADASAQRTQLGATAAGSSMFTAANAAAQTALLNAFTGDSGSGGVKGSVPAPGAGDAAAGKFLSADGTFAAPSILTPYFNVVTDGGVDPSDADCQPALEAAIAAATADGRTAWIPEGTFNFPNNSSVAIPSNARVFASANALLRRTADINAPIFSLASGVSNVHIDNVAFEYTPGSATTGATHCAIGVINSTDVQVTRVSTLGKFYVAIYVSDGSRFYIDTARIVGPVNRGIYLTGGQGGTTTGTIRTARVNNCYVDGLTTTFYGIVTNGFGTGFGDDLVIEGCATKDLAFHAFSSTERYGRVKLIGNHADNCNIGFLVQLANTFRNTRALLTNCTTQGGVNGFFVTESDYADIVGCQSWNSSGASFRYDNSQFINTTACTALLSGSSGFLTVAATSGSTQYLTYTGCSSVAHAGYGFSTDANTANSVIGHCTAIANTTGQYNTVNATVIESGNI